MADYERLSPTDASFLYWETPIAHMHVGGLVIYDDAGYTMDDVYAHTAYRLDQLPRFRRKLMWVPNGQGRPVWIDDDHFDIRYHVRPTGLPKPGGEAELYELVGRIMSRPLDRTRPLWEMWIVDLADGRKAMVHKTHHCMMDGVGGVDLAAILLDLTEEWQPPPPSAWEPKVGPTKSELWRTTVVERFAKPGELVRSVRAGLAAPKAAIDRAIEVGKGVVNFGKVPFESAPRTSLDTARIGSHRRIDLVRTNLADIKRVKNQYGCTVNDVVLALVAGGLRQLLLSRGDDIDGLKMRCTIPVSVRDDSQRMTYGNQIAAMFAELPVGEADPVDRLQFMRDQMADVKENKQALGAEALISLADFASPTLIALAGRAVARQWVMNLVVTNVPGPQFPLFFMGGHISEIVPMMPLVGSTAVGAAVLSYDGNLTFGLMGDWDAVPDLHIFAEGIEKSLQELLAEQEVG
jgi:diacylglycerol O-acyltransferase